MDVLPSNGVNGPEDKILSNDTTVPFFFRGLKLSKRFS